MTFGEKLRELREAKGLTRESLAESSGVPFGTIHGYEIGRRSPSLAAALALTKALGTDCTTFADCTDLIIDRENEKPVTPTKSKTQPSENTIGKKPKIRKPKT